MKRPNCGVTVRELTPDDLKEIYELREALEVEAVRILAGRRTVPQAARERAAELRGLNTRSPRLAVIEADLGFHRGLVVGTGNARLARTHHDLGGEIRMCLAQLVKGYASPRELALEHARLLEPIERGRPETAERAIRDHFSSALDWLVKHAVA